MPRFAKMLSEGMKERGHQVKMVSPKPFFFRLPIYRNWRKWMAYIDQYILFPRFVKKQLGQYTGNTLFVFTDQALGPWVPLVSGLPHVIHCHDFLAQQSALGEIPENKTGWTGKQYQAYIRRGYLQGRNFISVSKNTQAELHRFLTVPALKSEVVYNGLNQNFNNGSTVEARALLSKQLNLDLSYGYLLHVGGNQWYKNRKGVIEIYEAWRSHNNIKIPLLMIGKEPSGDLLELTQQSIFKTDIHWFSNMNDEQVRLCYTGGLVFIFPSLAEGFGWPIAEAMASGCPVITTNLAPMTEVAGDAAFLIERRPNGKDSAKAWAGESAAILNQVVQLTAVEREAAIYRGIENSKRFNSKNALDSIEAIYTKVLELSQNKQ
jgi:glycosyltransferase involved in cell wall biosynthesis